MLLIAVNVAVFAWQVASPTDRSLAAAGVEAGIDQTAVRYGAIPQRITHPANDECAIAGGELACGEATQEGVDQAPWWLTVLTAMFMAGSLLQLAVNMLFLWLFGKSVEDAAGPPRFLALYLVAGIAGTYLQAAVDSGSAAPLLGATPAIAGVLGAYALLYPRAAVICMVLIPFFVTFIELPALILIAVRFALQLVPSIGGTSVSGIATDSGVAWLALLGGFAVGLAVARPLTRGRRTSIEPARAVP